MTRRGWSDQQRRAFEQMLAEDRHRGLDRYLWTAERFFEGVDLTGKTVLEIGSGRGLRSLFMGLQGAKQVVSLEPGMAGSRGGIKELQRDRLAKLGLTNVEFVDADFNLWDPGAARFDVIVSESSINHLYESEHHALRHRHTYDKYLEICRKMHDLLNPGGVACISDAARYGFFPALKRFGVRRPWKMGKKLSVNWRIHQNAGVWRRILLAAGFEKVDIGYPLPFSMRTFGVLIANPVVNYFLRAHFHLRARR